ncbi:thioredoxin-like domain-containing protein [Flavobacterium sp.]|uniref:TlpA family protein disulfide reductase n=1 Tax=Flavobacterium sp. TaxID=239 RepID=UPI00286C4C43|nr:thioredoxin-like domain-containing protein [Flavobacterium sp.]
MMHSYRNIKIFTFVLPLIALLSSCKSEFKGCENVAYFGGEVVNPNNPYVLFCKDNEVIDTLKLDEKNRFFTQFDSLAPGLYTFKHEPEYQYVYFDKNDSIMVRVNSKDFDESIVFCGRGEEKNNFLMEMYLKNEKDKYKMFEYFDDTFEDFSKEIDSTYAKATAFYNTKKQEIKWSDDFDLFAKASLDFNYYSKKELYPLVHKIRTGEDMIEKIPANYYDYRKKIDFNNAALSNYAPYVMYLSHMLNNMGTINYHNHFSEKDLALKTNINKMTIADTLIKNEMVKNNILNNIAFTYLLEDQNMANNNTFLDTYKKLSTDKSQKNEITAICNAIQMLKVGNSLPEVPLIDSNGMQVSLSSLTKPNTIFFLWTEKAKSHLEAVHIKVMALKSKFPQYNFVAVNINDSKEDWKKTLDKYKFKGVTELHCSDFETIKNKWAINKIHRTIILDNKGVIKNAFANIFDSQFEENLK